MIADQEKGKQLDKPLSYNIVSITTQALMIVKKF